VRKLIGIHRARFLVTGAAPISPELVKWYLALGVPMLEVWGMTETCGASTGVPAARIKPGSIGPAAEFNEVKIDPATGEILVRGPNVFMPAT
jgi:long-chain acyl-CoA synthetase